MPPVGEARCVRSGRTFGCSPLSRLESCPQRIALRLPPVTRSFCPADGKEPLWAKRWLLAQGIAIICRSE